MGERLGVHVSGRMAGLGRETNLDRWGSSQLRGTVEPGGAKDRQILGGLQHSRRLQSTTAWLKIEVSKEALLLVVCSVPVGSNECVETELDS